MAEYFRPQIQRATIRRSLTALLCALLVMMTGSASSQTPADNQQGKAQVTLNLQDVDIRVLINTVAEVSGKNFIVDPRVKGKVSVISGAKLGPEELYDVFLSILEVHNFATVDSGNVIKILPANVIKQRPTPTYFTPTDDTNDEQITQIVQLEFASVQDLVPIIRPLIPPTSHFAPHVPSNSVVITDTAANIQRVLEIINRIDVPDKRANIHVVNLNFAKASELAATLTQLVTTTADPKDAATAAKISIQPFDAINSLVISAPDDQYTKIQALINELDIEREIEGDVNVISLKHAKAEDLASILKDVTSTSNAQGAVSEFTVQADEASNSLIVKASGTKLKTVESVVEKLDKRRAQVYVETIIAEVSVNQEGRLGITWNAGVPAPNLTTGEGENATTTPQTRLNTVGSRSGTGLSSTVFPNLATTAGFNYQLFDFGRYHLDVVLNALRSDSNSNVLSTPTILTLDNEEAEIIVGQEVPFVTGVFNNGLNNGGNNGGNGGNNGNNGSAIGSGFQTIERKDVGIKLKIKPQINEGDTIQLEVFQETSSVSDTVVRGQSDLITNRRSIEAVVQVDDGQVVALGGLITDDLVDTVEWVPFLGKIPVLGALFRNKSKRAVKRNLMVFLKPRIIRSPEDLKRYSKDKYDEVRRDSMEFANQSDDFLVLPEAEPPVLVKYDESVDDGMMGSEARKRRSEQGEPKKSVKRNIKDIIFGRNKQSKTSDAVAEPENNHLDGEVPVDMDADDELQAVENEQEVQNMLREIEARQSKTGESETDVPVFDLRQKSNQDGAAELNE